MSTPFDEYKKRYLSGQGDPFAQYRQRYGQTATPPEEAATPPPEEPSVLGGIARGVGTAIKEAVVGTAQFAAELGSPLNPGQLKKNPATGKLEYLAPTPSTTSGPELLKQAVLAPPHMIAAGGEEALRTGATPEQRAHGAATAALGALAGVGLVHGAKGLVKTARGVKPVEGAPAEAPKPATPEEVTPEQFAAREAELAKMKTQAEQVVKEKGAKKSALLRSAGMWNQLNKEQRAAVFDGLGEADYTKMWKDLPKESRQLVISKLSKDLEQVRPEDQPAAAVEAPASQPAGTAGAAEVAAPSAGVVPEQPLPPTPEPAAKPVESLRDVTGFSIADLRSEAARAEGKLQELTIKESMGTDVTKRGLAPERQAWEKYLEDLKDEQAKRLKRPEVKGVPQAVDKIPEPPEGVVGEIKPAAPAEANPLDRVIKIKRQLSMAAARDKARTAKRGLWANKTPEQITKSMEKDKQLVTDLTAEMEQLLPKLTEEQRTQLADRASTKDAVERQLNKQMESIKPAEPAPKPAQEPTPTQVSPAEPGQPIAGAPPEAPRPAGPPPSEPQAKVRTPEELDTAIDALDTAFENDQISQAEYTAGLKEIAAEKLRLKQSKPAGAIKPEPRVMFKLPDTIGKELTKFSTEQLSMAKKSIAALMRSPDIQNLPESALLKAEIDRILDYEAAIRRSNEGGFLNFGARKAVEKRRVEALPPHEQYFAKKVVLEPGQVNPRNWIKAVRNLYQGILRPSHSVNLVNSLFEGATGVKVPAYAHPGKLMEIMDGSLTQAEAWLKGDGPRVPDGQGGFSATGTPSLAAILERAGFDVEKFGWLWDARRALEVKALKGKSIGTDLAMAHEMFLKAPQNLHEAVDLGRQYNLDLAKVGQIEGLISKETLGEFAKETSYGPLEVILNEETLVSKMAEEINKGGRAENLLGTQPFKKLKGDALQHRNMVETTQHATFRILRAAKMNRFARSLVDEAIAQPDLYRGVITRLGHRQTLAVMADMTARAKAIKAIFEDHGIDMSLEHANFWANGLSDKALQAEGGILRVWRDGKAELWQVDEMLTHSIKSMTPAEFVWPVRALGMAARPLRWGVVLDPMFIANQLVIDQFQIAFNSRYGVVPVLDPLKAYFHIMRETPEFKTLLHAGGVERSSLRPRTGLTEMLAGPNVPPLKLAAKEIAQLHPLKAMNVLLTPLREATRTAEALRALESGASPTEAVWAARDVLGNYSMQGTFMTVRALNHMAAFSGPALAVLDKTARVIANNPARWVARASILGVISGLLYAANDGDKEIERLRQTPDGQRWWYFRIGEHIYKWRKPYLEGAVFGSGVEAALDQMKGENPEAFSLWLKAMRNEVGLAAMPVAGTVAAEIWANKNWRTGSPIVPEDQQGLDSEYQTGNYSGTAERFVGRQTGIPPAIISHVLRGFGGYMGESAVRGISAAIDYNVTHELPAVEDRPFTQRLFARYPSSNTRPIREFYDNLQVVEQAANSIAEAERNHPEDLERKLQEHEKELPLIEMYNDARQQIADLRRSAEALDNFKDIGPQTKKTYRDEFLRQIIDLAETTNLIAAEIKKAAP